MTIILLLITCISRIGGPGCPLTSSRVVQAPIIVFTFTFIFTLTFTFYQWSMISRIGGLMTSSRVVQAPIIVFTFTFYQWSMISRIVGPMTSSRDAQMCKRQSSGSTLLQNAIALCVHLHFCFCFYFYLSLNLDFSNWIPLLCTLPDVREPDEGLDLDLQWKTCFGRYTFTFQTIRSVALVSITQGRFWY